MSSWSTSSNNLRQSEKKKKFDNKSINVHNKQNLVPCNYDVFNVF